MSLDLHDLSACPVAPECDLCGGAGPLGVYPLIPVDPPMPVHCLSLCGKCEHSTRTSDDLLSYDVVAAVNRHVHHVGGFLEDLLDELTDLGWGVEATP